MDETYVREAIELARCTMYTSTEPCEMCSAAIHYAGLDRVVYSVLRRRAINPVTPGG